MLRFFIHLSLLPFLSIAIAANPTVPNCLNCIDAEGKNCDDFFKRYGKTKYWIMKGQGDEVKQSFSDAESTCTKYGKVIPEIKSDSDYATFKELAEDGNHQTYWTVKDDGSGTRVPQAFDKDEGQQSDSDPSESHATVCQYPEAHPCISKNPLKPDVPEDDSPCPQPDFGGNNRFIRTGPNSKYLYPMMKTFGSWENGKMLCDSAGLELASIVTIKDYSHLKDDWIKKNKFHEPKNKAFYATLAAKSDDGSGVLKDVHTGRALSVQFFNIFDMDMEQGPGCAALETIFGIVQFATIPCEDKVFLPLCQYPRNSDCYKNSPLGIYEQEESDELLPVGTTTNRAFVGSRRQKTWLKAMRFCNERGYKLLDFDKEDPLESSMLWRIVSKYQEIVNFPYNIGKSWTSGMFPNGFEVGAEFTFESTGEIWKYEESEPHFQWLVEDIRNPDKERCLVVAGAQQLTPVSCQLANFFLCYKEKPKPETTTTTTTPAPTSSTTKATTTTTEMTEVSTPKPSICKGDLIQLSFSPGGFTNEEIISLIGYSENFHFYDGYSNVLKIKEESSWRVAHVKAMGALTKYICPDPLISQDFVNILMNLVMIYYNSVPEIPRSKSSKQMWKKLLTRYEKCANNTAPFNFMSEGGLVVSIKKGKNEPVEEITIAKEIVDNDKMFAPDFVLEGLWYMFEVTAGACYNLAKWKTTWLAEYFYNFRADFTEPFRDWWISPGVDNYGLLFGDIDLYANLYNLRACAVAGFQRLKISDRLPVRPVTIDDTNFLMRDINQRLI